MSEPFGSQGERKLRPHGEGKDLVDELGAGRKQGSGFAGRIEFSLHRSIR